MRRTNRLLSLAPVFLFLLGSGCATGMRGSAGALRAGNPARAESIARTKLLANDKDPASWRDLGIALYELGRFADSLDPLEKALVLAPRDRAALLFRARALDRLSRQREALAAYTPYLAETHGKRQAEAARGRMEQIRRQLIEVEIHRALAREDSLRAAVMPENSVAVPDFANPAASDTLRPIAKGLAVMLTTDLARIEALRVLERHRVQVVLQELELSGSGRGPVFDAGGMDPAATVRGQQQRLAQLTDPNTGQLYYDGKADGLLGPRFTAAVLAFQRANILEADGVGGPRTQRALDEVWRAEVQGASRGGPIVRAFDPEEAPRVGRLLRARRLVQGTVLPAGDSDIELHGDLLETTADAASGDRPTTAPIGGPIRKVLELEKRLAEEVLRLLGIPIRERERAALDTFETRDFEAFFAFCRGLDFEDRGMRNEALAAYREAAARDGGFTLAQVYADALALDDAALEHLEGREIGELQGEGLDHSRRPPRQEVRSFAP